ncbi:MAG: hypothetical protein KF906_04850 [Actinobacteria bacterium]|nr:hypothetical protein [Actinomycetota bacterium]
MTTALRSTRPAPAPVPTRAPRPAPRRRSGDHLQVVRPSIGRGRRLVIGVLVVGVVFGSLLCAAVFQAMLVTGQDHLDDTRREISEIQQELQRDRASLATVQSPEHLALEAARLGMVDPAGRDWIQVDSGVTTSDAADGTAATGTGDGSELAAPPGTERTEVAEAR